MHSLFCAGCMLYYQHSWKPNSLAFNVGRSQCSGDSGFMSLLMSCPISIVDLQAGFKPYYGTVRVRYKIYGHIAGTITHMAPEVLSSGMVSKGADVFAFGVLMWECYMGRRAWEGSTPPQVMLAVCVKKESLTFPDNAPLVRVDMCSVAPPIQLKFCFNVVASFHSNLCSSPNLYIKPLLQASGIYLGTALPNSLWLRLSLRQTWHALPDTQHTSTACHDHD